MPFALDAVKKRELTVTIGGHFIEGAWVAVLLFDYLHGIDFAKEKEELRSKMGIITQENVSQYADMDTLFSKAKLAKVDFTRFSKHLNPTLKQYRFNMDDVIKQANQ